VTSETDSPQEVFGGWGSWDEAGADLRSSLTAEVVGRLGAAYEFAAQAHAGQVRPGGEPYVVHLLEVLQILVQAVGGTDEDLLTAALLHDVVEDTSVTATDVQERFGPGVGELVGWVTMPPFDVGNRQQVRTAYLEHLRTAPRRVLQLKLADRYSNAQRLETHPRPEKQASYAQETIEHFLPLAAEDPCFGPLFAAWRQRMEALGIA
jgi:guanosine-3',5'-bis(diphosphate) 3'-pyrophosphohydrolase